ncbi:MAG: glutaredoxin-like protein NrdH [Kocuria sp.]|nr:glutaredoxin-like protein NrdH [Kocuria sp.]
MSADVTVYAKPLCVQCDATKRALNKAGVAYDVVDITEDDAARARVRAMGYAQAPVVVTEHDHWSGFRPDKIKAIPPTAAAPDGTAGP